MLLFRILFAAIGVYLRHTAPSLAVIRRAPQRNAAAVDAAPTDYG